MAPHPACEKELKMYPRTIVPLKASQMATTGSYNKYDDKTGDRIDGCGCLGAHAERLFKLDVFCDGGSSYSKNPMVKALKETTGSNDLFYGYNRSTPAREQAAAFNRALIRIGYKRRGKLLVWAGKPKPRKSAKAVQP